MKRNSFLAAILTLTSLPLLSFKEWEQEKKRETKGFKVKAGEGRYHGDLKLKGVNANILKVKISGKDTDGDLAIFEQISLTQGRGTPLHVHYLQDEIFFILEGAYFFQVGEQRYSLNTGDSIFLPRNVPHAWTQISESGRMSVTVQPAGKLEEFFISIASLDHEPSPQEIQRIFAENEMKVLGPPLQPE
jgi:quercetin dioxygenase-like cupin family protein